MDGRTTQPWPVVRLAGLFVPFMKELRETRYQWDGPFVMDSSAATATFGDRAADLTDALAATVAWWRQRLDRVDARAAA